MRQNEKGKKEEKKALSSRPATSSFHSCDRDFKRKIMTMFSSFLFLSVRVNNTMTVLICTQIARQEANKQILPSLNLLLLLLLRPSSLSSPPITLLPPSPPSPLSLLSSLFSESGEASFFPGNCRPSAHPPVGKRPANRVTLEDRWASRRLPHLAGPVHISLRPSLPASTTRRNLLEPRTSNADCPSLPFQRIFHEVPVISHWPCPLPTTTNTTKHNLIEPRTPQTLTVPPSPTNAYFRKSLISMVLSSSPHHHATSIARQHHQT